MHLHIKRIILWPRKAGLEPRYVDLSSQAVNVLTGQSETGKSALLWIVDYCLGSRKCAIPVGLIRQTTEWFGLHIELERSEVLIARREPGDQQQTSDAFLLEAPIIDSYPRPETNCAIDDFKMRMNEAARLSGLNLDGGDSDGGFRGRASFRDMAAFNFQPQHVVANPYTLFFKADTHNHQEKLRAVFPLVLGSIDNLTLIRRRELRDLERDYDRLRRELDARRQALYTWTAELRTAYLRAIELGLLRDAPQPSEAWTPGRYIGFLRSAITRSKETLPEVEEGSTERILSEIDRISRQEQTVSRELGFKRHKLRQLEQLSHSSGGFREAIESQGDRLHGVGWFLERLERAPPRCPLCGSEAEGYIQYLRALKSVAVELQRASSAAAGSSTLIDREVAQIRRELRELEAELNEIRSERGRLESADEEVRGKRQQLEEVYRFAGQLEQAITSFDASGDDGDLAQRASALSSRIDELRSLVDAAAEERRRRLALDLISRYMVRHLERVGVARAEAPAHLDITNLTLRIVGEGAREDFLWEIGSGANWMGYHVATLLALHEHFLNRGESPVPTFLFIDQPSQAFFPDRWPTPPSKNDRVPEHQVTAIAESDDIRRVQKIFATLVAAFRELRKELQIIVVDHAGETTWSGLPVNLVGRWRDGEVLIPEAWQ